MITIGKVVNPNYIESDMDEGKHTGKMQIRIEPLFKDIKDEDLPFARPMITNGNEFTSFQINDLVYIYVQDDDYNNMYYLGKLNKTVDLGSILTNMDEINQLLDNTIIKDLEAYDLDYNNIKIMAYGNQLMMFNAEEHFTLIANKDTGSHIYIDASNIILKHKFTNINVSNSEIKIQSNNSKNSEINVRGNGTISVISQGDIVINSPKISLGAGTGYVVTSPSPGVGATQSGMTLKAVDNIKAG